MLRNRVLKLKIVEYEKDYEDSPSPITLTLPTQLIVTVLHAITQQEKLLKGLVLMPYKCISQQLMHGIQIEVMKFQVQQCF